MFLGNHAAINSGLKSVFGYSGGRRKLLNLPFFDWTRTYKMSSVNSKSLNTGLARDQLVRSETEANVCACRQPQITFFLLWGITKHLILLSCLYVKLWP